MATITTRVIRNARKRGVVFHTRRQWKSQHMGVYLWRVGHRRHRLLPKKPVDTVWQHITVTKDTGNLDADMRMLESIGMDRFGSGVSYNFAISMKTGRVGLGQSLTAAGTHTLNDKGATTPTGEPLSFNQNYVSVAIAFIGMPGDEVSHEAKLAASRLIAALIDEKAVTFNFDYLPHRLVAYKDCPTDNVVDEMTDIYNGARRLYREQKHRK